MSEIKFEVWASQSEGQALKLILREQGVTVSDSGPLQHRSLNAADATIIVAVSGAVVAIARAFEAYFRNRDKRLGAGTDKGNIYAENYSVEEVQRILRSSKHIFITDKSEKKGPNDA